MALCLCFAVVATGCSSWRADRDCIYQVAPIKALLAGCYDGDVTCGELRNKGDLGLGTFDHLDGEMIVVDRKVYRARSDGGVELVPDGVTTPFAAVTFFEPDQRLKLHRPLGLDELKGAIDAVLPSPNYPYAVRIDGTFEWVRVRSVPRQDQPYQRLVEVVKDQPTFDLHDVSGTMVGFRLPGYVDGVNVPGYHLHFIAADRFSGGHVLDGRSKDVTVGLDLTPRLTLVLPEDEGFAGIQMGDFAPDELDRVER